MDEGGSRGTNDSELRGRVLQSITRSGSSSLRLLSMSSLGAHSCIVDDDIGSESVSEAGDIGDRALYSNRYSASGSLNFLAEEDMQLQSYGFWSRDPAASHAVSTVTPLPEEIISTLSAKAVVLDEEKNQVSAARILKFLEYGSCMTHLAVFGILGVLTRYLLQKLFGPGVSGVTNDQTILYLDLPSNMVGSFLMGWFGVVFKADISYRSEFLAIGLTTGYLGSVTTFSGWNQKMLELTVEGHWLFAGLGFLIGLFLAAYSIIFGIETSKLFRQLLVGTPGSSNASSNGNIWRVDTTERHLMAFVFFLLLLAGLWSMSGILVSQKFNRNMSETELWLACILGPLGVWIRWFLARLNGRGLGKTGFLKWMPFGTLVANVSASCIMAGVATVKIKVNTRTCDIVATGIQFGFLGCLSTVSTFIAEFNAMRESKCPWRAYVYALVTILASFCLGILIYSVPVWS